jgi:hypothetical protein
MFATRPRHALDMRSSSILFLVAAALVVVPVHAQAQAPAPAEGTRYAVLYQALSTADAARRFDRLMAIQHVESKLAGVQPSQIKIVIRSLRGDVPVPVKGDGEIAFPVTPELLDENPVVVTNQPRGSLTLSVTLALRLPAGSRVRVDALEAALAQADALLTGQAAAGAAPRVVGVEFQFAPDAPGGITLRGANERWLVADASGRLRLMRAGDLDKGVTELEFAARPTLVLPYLGN